MKEYIKEIGVKTKEKGMVRKCIAMEVSIQGYLLKTGLKVKVNLSIKTDQSMTVNGIKA